MKNKPMLSADLRKALADFIECSVPGPLSDDAMWYADKKALRALLDEPAKPIPECVGDLERFEADDGVFVRLGDVIDMLANEKAVQHQGEPIGWAPLPDT